MGSFLLREATLSAQVYGLICSSIGAELKHWQGFALKIEHPCFGHISFFPSDWPPSYPANIFVFQSLTCAFSGVQICSICSIHLVSGNFCKILNSLLESVRAFIHGYAAWWCAWMWNHNCLRNAHLMKPVGEFWPGLLGRCKWEWGWI